MIVGGNKMVIVTVVATLGEVRLAQKPRYD